MDKLTNTIYTEIKRQYKSVRRFALNIGIPQTTLASALKNGIGGTSYDTVVKICEALNIKLVNYENPIKIDDDTLIFLKKYNALDDYGIHTIQTVLEMEYSRCINENLTPASAATYSGRNFTSNGESVSDIEVHELLRDINSQES